LDANVMAVAIATYVTKASFVSVHFGSGTSDLVAEVESFGITVTAGGVGSTTVNVGNSGAAFGVADNTDMRVIDILLATDRMSLNGLLYDDADSDGVGDGTIGGLEEALRRLAHDVYAFINEL
jgi:hypothetical protein